MYITVPLKVFPIRHLINRVLQNLIFLTPMAPMYLKGNLGVKCRFQAIVLPELSNPNLYKTFGLNIISSILFEPNVSISKGLGCFSYGKTMICNKVSLSQKLSRIFLFLELIYFDVCD